MNNTNRKIVMALGVLSLLTVAAMPSVLASTAAYVKYDGIDGESSDMAHEGWIDLVAVSQPLHKPGTGSGAARRRGDVILEDITVTKTSDKASPKLAEAVCNGTVFPKVEIHVTASADDPSRSTYYRYELTNVRVTSYSVSASGSGAAGDVPQEQISLNFEEIKVSYDRAMTKGKSKGKVEATWKVEEGQK